VTEMKALGESVSGSVKGVELLDCTIRDGGYLNDWRFEPKLVREVYRAASKAGVDYVELGFRSAPGCFDPETFGLWRFSPEDAVMDACSGIGGAKVVLMADFGKIRVEDFLPEGDSIVSMVRLAAHKHDLRDAIAFLGTINELGYETSLQAMGYSGFSVAEQDELVSMLRGSGVDYAYIADSYGSIYPDQVPGLVERMLTLEGEVKIGFHPHNSLQMAFANTIQAIRSGVDIVDSSIFGMGRGAGNLPTEIIVSYLQESIPEKYNVIPVLEMVDRHFVRMKQELGWGYQLPFMLSGLFAVHPYYSSKLVDMREYTMEDIWRALSWIKKKRPVGFSSSLLDEVVENGMIGPHSTRQEDVPESGPASIMPAEVPYMDRHVGRPFLVLGNGPSLKTHRDQITAFIERHDPVVVGANYLGGMFVPDYHAFSNKLRLISHMDTVDSVSMLMISEHIPDELVREYTDREFERLYYVDTMRADFGILDGVIQANCRTVSVLLMGVAVVMGAAQVFAAGMDGYLATDEEGEILFYEEDEEKRDRALVLDMHYANKRFISQIDAYLRRIGGDGVHILTPTSYEGFYKGINNYL